jgi:hypothetical protein
MSAFKITPTRLGARGEEEEEKEELEEEEEAPLL